MASLQEQHKKDVGQEQKELKKRRIQSRMNFDFFQDLLPKIDNVNKEMEEVKKKIEQQI